MRSYMRWWLIAVLVIAIARILSGCTRVVPTPTTIEMEPWRPCDMQSYCQIGQVVCSQQNQPVIVIRKGLDAEQMPFTLLHEGVHVSQMQGRCNEVRQKFRTDSIFRFHMELEAYCKEYGARIKLGASPEIVVGTLEALLSALYDVSEDDVVCPWLQKSRR